jgi:tRNA-dihydrouridine synthase
MKDFWQKFPKPIIGLAPMDGYTDSAFRQVCKLVNPQIITYTEFTSTDGLVFNCKKIAISTPRKTDYRTNIW